jgi:predicted phosphodiesterase
MSASRRRSIAPRRGKRHCKAAVPIVIAGDPHGNFVPIVQACGALDPGTLILLGDCELRAPLRKVLAPLFGAAWQVRWIIGNKDAETEAAFDNLLTDFAEGDIGGQVVNIDGLRIAGLGGVFKPRIWDPGVDETPSFDTRDAFLASLDAREHWRGGLPLWHRDSIFPEDFARLALHRFDVLVSHEAPSCHRHGYAVIDRLAQAGGARLIVHGHHHKSYAATLANGIRVRGLGVAETWLLEIPSPPPGAEREG